MSMASDDDVIYVDVVPKLDEGEAEKATGRLRDKLKDGVKGAGKAVSDVFHSELAQELGRSIGPVAHDMGVELGKQLGSKAGDLLHEQISDALKGIGVDFDGVIDHARQLADEFGVDADSVGKLADAFKAAKAGDEAKAFSDLAEALQKVPGPVGDVAQKSKGLLDTFGSLKGDIKETAHGFMDLTNNSGKIAGGLDAIAAAAGPLAGTFAALDALMPGFDQHLNSVLGQIQGKQPFNAKDWFNTLVPGTNLFDQALKPFAPAPQHNPVNVPPPAGATPPPNVPGASRAPIQGPSSSVQQPGDLGGLLGAGAGAGADVHTSGSVTGGTHQATLVDQISGGGAPGFPGMGTGTVNNDLLAALGRAGIDTRMFPLLQGFAKTEGNNPSGVPTLGFTDSQAGSTLDQHAQALATQLRTRQSVAGPFPANGTPQEQASWMATVVGQNGLPSDWQGNAQPSRQSYVNSIVSGFGAGTPASGGVTPAGHSFYNDWYGSGAAPNFYKDWYPTAGGASLPPSTPGAGAGLPGIGMPPGMMPGLVAPPTMPNMGGGSGGAGPVSQQQVGSGSGVGVTGGGALGMAEQAGVMAAAMFGFGGGGMAAQIGMQEMNLAIQKGGQMGATLAMALPETFGIKGGQMGAPAIGQGGWIHKIIGGLMGQQFNSPNIAGATQPPKKQQQGEEGQPQEDPLNANKSPQGQAGGGGKQGPSGHKDDPIHVQQVPQPGGQPQGQATSAMNAAGVMSAITA